MKRLRKLQIRQGQELDVAAQGLIVAGWGGSCTCHRIGNSHEETESYTFTYTDVSSVVAGVGCYVFALGIAGYSGGAGLGASVALCVAGYNFMSNSEKAVTIVRHREMELTSVRLWRHRVKNTWTTYS